VLSESLAVLLTIVLWSLLTCCDSLGCVIVAICERDPLLALTGVGVGINLCGAL
jgi:hypothetical protein